MSNFPFWRVNEDKFNATLESVSSRFSSKTDVDALAIVLMAVWETVEGEAATTSRVATFADMAAVVLAMGGQAAVGTTIDHKDE